MSEQDALVDELAETICDAEDEIQPGGSSEMWLYFTRLDSQGSKHAKIELERYRHKARAALTALEPHIQQRIESATRELITDPDDDRKPCEVCKQPVYWGSRHWVCGDALLKSQEQAVVEATPAIEQAHLDRLIAKCDEESGIYFAEGDVQMAMHFAGRSDWLESQRPVEGEDGE